MNETLQSPDYTVELWDLDGIFVADISHIIRTSLRLSSKLNDVEDISLTIDLVQFEKMCADIGVLPRNILEPYVTDIRIRRNGQYLMGGQVVAVQGNFNTSDYSLEIKATGYLNYFKDRYKTGNYTNKTYAQIAWQMIKDSQDTGANWDFGVTLGGDSASSGQAGNRVREYDNQEIKDGIINLTKLENDNFDFYFTHDKKVYFTPRQGSDKPEIILEYPQNLASMIIAKDASTLANTILAIGSGMGDERIEATANSVSSQLNYKVRQRVSTYSDVSQMATLQAKVRGERDFYSELYSRPIVHVRPGELDINDVWIGDAVTIRNYVSTTLSLDGLYRIVGLDIDWSVDGEENVSLEVEAWSA